MKRKLTGDHNECPGCGLYFNSTVAFDKHRTGAFGIDRRCRTPEEMRAAGMVLNQDGWWITKHRPDDAVAARRHDQLPADT